MRAAGAAALAMLTLCAGCGAPQPVNERFLPRHEYSVEDGEFLRVMGRMVGSALTGGNHVQTLVNGDEVFPAMLDAIRGAERTITLETYIYWDGEVGRRFAEALAERARAGVRVHVIIDAMGSERIDEAHARLMTDSGVALVRYHALRWFDPFMFGQINYRTHRKILVVDGKVGFTGGVGIADPWLGDAASGQWRDNHYRVEGPVVANLQGAFAENWLKSMGELLHGDDYFPRMQRVNGGASGDGMIAQVVRSSPENGSAIMELMVLLSVTAATESIYIQTPYFIPDEPLIDALRQARQRGVTVRIMVPGSEHSDVPVVNDASRSRWGRLIDAGIELYCYQGAMMHCKLLVVDRVWTSVGSANIDFRSFRLNDELNLNVYDPALAQRQIELFTDDLQRCRRITQEQWHKRPLGERVAEFFASLLDSQL